MTDVAPEPTTAPIAGGILPTSAVPKHVSVEDLQLILAALQLKAPTTRVLTKPRVGGISSTGVWTGMGAGGEGLDPYGNHCMREFNVDIHKNHTALYPIQEKCKKGLSASPEFIFGLTHEANATTVVSSIRAFEKFIVECGMDGVFRIVAPDSTPLEFLQEPGLVTPAIIDVWCTDLLVSGVWKRQPDGSLQRQATCPFDRINLHWSGEALLSSCTPALRLDLENQIPLVHRNGPSLFMAMLLIIYRPSQSKIDDLREQLGALDIRKFPAENVTLFCQAASQLIREIKMNFMAGVGVNDLTTTALKGLRFCSDPELRSSVRRISMENDVHGFGGSLGNKKADALQILRDFEDMYRVLVNLKDYAPALQPSKTTQASAYQALVQDRTATASRPPGRPRSADAVCWDCGSKTHFRGHADCPGSTAVAGSGAPVPAALPHSKHGLDDATHSKVLALCKAKLATMPARENIPDEAEYSVLLDGKVVAQYCRHCGRFTKGASQHYTKTHTGTRLQFAYQGPAPSLPAAALPAPVPVAGNVAHFSPTAAASPPSAPVPSIDNQVFLRRQEVNYDFAAMSVAGNLASSTTLPVDDISVGQDPHDETSVLAFLLNEFGG
jgi:hypothetical protein